MIIILHHIRNVRTKKVPKFVPIIGILDELKVSWDGSTCKHIHKKCHYKVTTVT